MTDKLEKRTKMHDKQRLSFHGITLDDLNGKINKSINQFRRKRLKNKNFSLISSNCTGGVLLHDLGLRFNSPFVNLWISGKDYVKMLSNLREYMECSLSFVNDESIGYPVGILRDIKIHFLHYDNNETALEEWNKRKERINYDNLFVIFTDKNEVTYDDIKEYDKLPYRNKIVFTHVKYPEIKSSFYIKGFENKKCLGDLFLLMPKRIGMKYYDQFNYVKWFNGRLKPFT